MNIFERSKKDWNRFTSDSKNGGGIEITILFPDLTELIVGGPAVKHHMSVDDLGVVVNTKQAYCSFSEQQVIDASKTIRNASDEINLTGFIFKFKDSRDVLKTYIADQWYPDETVGNVVCTLSVYSE